MPLDYRDLDTTNAASLAELKGLLDGLDARVVALETAEPPPDPPDEPAPGTLRWKPPGYPNYTGFVRVDLTTSAQSLTLDNTKDYLLTGAPRKVWQSGSGRTIGLHINGGRNVVAIGGAYAFTRTNASDDATAVLVDGGDPNGTVHLEGLDIDCANGITVRTRRAVQIENCRIRVWSYQDNHSSIHPDVVQVWGNIVPCAAIRMHKVTGLTRYSGLVCLVDMVPSGSHVDPLVWERYDVDLHPDINVNGTRDAGNFGYMASGPTGTAGGPYTTYTGEVYAELPTGGGGAYVRGIDDIVILRTLSPSPAFFPYEIRTPDGTAVYTSAASPSGGSGLAVAKQAGNYLTYSRVPAFAGHKWRIGKPPAGEFCPAGVAGTSYVSPGYV